MTQEEKNLLLQDLCARLPYRVKCHYNCVISYDTMVISKANAEGELKGIIPLSDGHIGFMVDYDKINALEGDIKPYLRPMSSMTEEEKDYIKNVARFKQSDGIHYDDGVHYVPIYQETLDDQWKTDGKFPPILGDIYRFMLDYGYILLIDFFNSHHIDYRGLIEKGLALEAPEGMYSIKTE